MDGRYAHLEMYSMTVTGGAVDLTQSYITDADMQAILPLGQWTHVVAQGNGLANNNLAIYVNGVKCPVVTNATPGGCGWDLASGASAPVLPQNLANLKHMRLYSRLLTEAEIAANAVDACMAAADKTKMDYWFRYNTPASGAGSAGSSLAETTISPIYPGHTLTTSYAYQSLNGPTIQVSPDGGIFQNWYDYLGRVSVAQNAEQKAGSRYSYSSYDEQNRIVEVGEKSSGNTMDASVGFVPAATMTAFAASGTNSQIMHTWYDKQYDGFGYTQENLRKRVSAKSYQDGSSTPQMTYYSYDQIGMVKTLWQQIDGLGTKQIEYNYDLASGKVNKLRYQHLNNDNTTADQFYYGYEYDADNKVVKALTGIRGWSNDGWEIENPKTDVHYNYYLHGPLSRSELGNKQLVQGTDYAYTLQGWVKGVNSQYLNTAADMGQDGLASGDHSVVAPDVFGYTLDYFNTDYWAVANKSILPLTWGSPATTTAAGHDLYNGNISRMTVASAQFGNTVGYSYKYDQLNRMKAMRQHPVTLGATSWDAATAGAAYKEDVTYDGNGNILTYNRNGSGANGKGVAMDQLTYGYNRDASGYLTNNKLTQVTDAVTTNDYGTADLKSQAGDNYGYDLIGNMVSDVQEGVSNITWTVYGKIKKITKIDGSTLEYKYDADGNRVCKVYTHGTQLDKTWYVRDASGNVLAIYGNKDGDGNVYWKEQQLYGSSRLGSWYPELNVSGGADGAVALWSSTNKKQYELSNHLGNVLATVTDELKADNTALVMSANDYYPFGMIQPDRSYSSGGYRYGFNGKENDNEVKGEGNQQDYGMRVYDPRVGRFLSVDPLTPQFPELTAYQFGGNSPVAFIDLDGLEATFPISLGRVIEVLNSFEVTIPPPPAIPIPPVMIPKNPAIPAPVSGLRAPEGVPIDLSEPGVIKIPSADLEYTLQRGQYRWAKSNYRKSELDDPDYQGPYKEKKQVKSGEKQGSDVPDWAENYRPQSNEDPKGFARRLLDKKYGKGNWKDGPGTEYNRIKKFGERHFVNSILLTPSQFRKLYEDATKYNEELKEWEKQAAEMMDKRAEKETYKKEG